MLTLCCSYQEPKKSSHFHAVHIFKVLSDFKYLMFLEPWFLFYMTHLICNTLQEEEKRGQQNYEHLDEDLHVLISVEDTEDRAKLRLAKGVEKVKDLLQPVVSLSHVQKDKIEKELFCVFSFIQPVCGKLQRKLVNMHTQCTSTCRVV